MFALRFVCVVMRGKKKIEKFLKKSVDTMNRI